MLTRQIQDHTTLVIAIIFSLYPESVLSVWVAMPLAIAVGIYVHRRPQASLLVPSLLALLLLYVAVYIGVYHLPVSLLDRLMAIRIDGVRILTLGDTGWQNYEVVLPIWVDDLRPDKNDGPSFSALEQHFAHTQLAADSEESTRLFSYVRERIAAEDWRVAVHACSTGSSPSPRGTLGASSNSRRPWNSVAACPATDVTRATIWRPTRCR